MSLPRRARGSASKGRIVLATVKGDVHDIGKNIVKVILENYGFEVIDLGRDVPVETVVNTVREKNVHLVGLSALMTTTLKSMEETIAALHEAGLDCKIMVGGAVLTPEYAEKIGADWYAKDAKRSADIAKGILRGAVKGEGAVCRKHLPNAGQLRSIRFYRFVFRCPNSPSCFLPRAAVVAVARLQSPPTLMRGASFENT